MARADLLIDSVRAGAEGNQELFRRALEALITEERSKQHHVLADRLAAHLLLNGHSKTTAPITPRSASTVPLASPAWSRHGFTLSLMASDASQLSLYREPDWLKSITLLGQFKIHSGSLGSIHNGFGIFFIDPPEAVTAPAPLPLCGTGMAFGYGHVCIVGSPFEPIHGTFAGCYAVRDLRNSVPFEGNNSPT
ncbi:MAG: hypothetical protein NTW51_14785 [Cyanobacteria bacterium]|nr:hypothetical protein [Cyanobacteriota bacterium]